MNSGNIHSNTFLYTLFGVFVGGVTSIAAYKLFNESPGALRRRLRRKIHQAETIKDPLNQLEENSKPIVRIWIDGCFDMMHFGHANAFRQARSLGTHLIVGLQNDEEIKNAKGPPIMNDEERYLAVSGCKWVDEVVRDVPYTMNAEFVAKLLDKNGPYKIDYIVHGDDPCLLPDGTDVFATSKSSGQFRTIKRTEGVSTTDIVGRMLLMTRNHHNTNIDNDKDDGWDTTSLISVDETSVNSFIRKSEFLPTARRIMEFSRPIKIPKSNDVIVYIDGAWDLFHAGHVEILKSAKELGTFLIVGVHSDDVVNKIRGSNFPIFNLHERILSVLSCRYVDEVIYGAPFSVSTDMIKTLNIQVVCHGSVRDSYWKEDPYAIPREMNIAHELTSKRQLTAETIVDRIIAHRLSYEKKFAKKQQAEEEYKATKEYVQEL